MDQEVETECENVLAWKACTEKCLDLWYCGINHQSIQEGYPKTSLSDFWNTENSDVGGTARPFFSERTESLLFLKKAMLLFHIVSSILFLHCYWIIVIVIMSR